MGFLQRLTLKYFYIHVWFICNWKIKAIILQIVGEHDSVKSALFQLTGRLREAFFSSLVSEEAVPRNYPYSSCSHGSLHEIGTSMPSQLDHSFSSLDKMDHLGFVPNLGVPHSLLQDKQV